MNKDYHNIAVIPGDLNGITVTDAVLKLSEAVSHKLKKPIKHTIFNYNADYFLKHDIKELGEKELTELATYDQIFLGAIGDPVKIKPGIVEIGILLTIRQKFDQYVNLRPIVLPEGVESILVGKTSEDINFEICRENSEGLYVDKGELLNEGTDEEIGIQEMRCSYKGVKRLVEFAVQRARLRKKFDKPKIHFVFKRNVLTYAASPWTRVEKEVREKYPDLEINYMHIDNFLMQILLKPEQFDVVVTENMFGDIATDAGAVLQGGIGSAVSGNINPAGKFPSMFEPIHGSVPNRWYEKDENGEYIPGTKNLEKIQTVKAEAAFFSYAMMLEQAGELEAADAIRQAALVNMRDPEYRDKKLDQLVEQACKFVKDETYGKTLYDKVWENHLIGQLPTGQSQIFVGRHLVHEVTSPQAFQMIKEKDIPIKHPKLTFAILDHVIPTCDLSRPFKDEQAELMSATLENNIKEYNIKYFGSGSGQQGICHVAFPEQGLIWPGQIAVCGDSHTCTYGAFGALAFGIGTTQVSHVLATQSLAMDKLKVRKINFNGKLNAGVTSKDLALYMIKKLGVEGGVGFAYEFTGEVVEKMDMEERMTLCNMAVEAGARLGYVNPDQTTFDYLKNKSFAPKEDFEKAVDYWKSIASDKDAKYDDIIDINISEIEPIVTWGVNPAQAIEISEQVPLLDEFSEEQKKEVKDALEYMNLNFGDKLENLPIDVVFIGSCTNGRLSDLKAAAEIFKGRKVAVKTLIVPGSESVKKQAEELGLDKIFRDAGVEWRYPGCSMCLAMNPDKLIGGQRCASTSNRNFKGRQGSATGRTHLMSPYMAAASAIEGKISDPRKYIGENYND